MKKYKLGILFFLIIFSAFVFNLNYVHAEELDDETETVEVEDKKEEIVEVKKEEPREEAKEDTKIEPKNESKEEKVEKEDVVDPVEPTEKVTQENEEPEEEQVIIEGEVDDDEPEEKPKQDPKTNDTPLVEQVSAPADNNTKNDKEDSDDSIPVQKAKVIITKVDEDGNVLPGAVLQILNSKGKVIKEFTSGKEAFEIMLPDGTYTLHEAEAPKGYEAAENKTFKVEISVPVGTQADTEYPNVPCEAATTYYVELDGKKHEVYCINQYLSEPGSEADYNGQILRPEDVRKYTQQITLKDPYKNTDDNYSELRQRYPAYITNYHGHLTDGPIDVSDQTLEDGELYNILLDIVYRRTIVREDERFADIPDAAISYMTEAALKTYTNAGITQIQRFDALQPGEEAIYEQDGKYYWYLMHMYKDYVYDPESPNGFRVDIGHGDALGNFARHWTINRPLHETKNLSVDHPEYADLFYYLMGDETSSHLTHPDGMNIYIYTALNTPEDDDGYQNLLGITGYLDVEVEPVEVEIVNKYSTETRDIPVEKIWDDKGNIAKTRPDKVTVNLYADGVKIQTVEISKDTDWKYTFTDLPKYNKGQLIKYTVDEVELDEYFYIIDGDMDEGFYVININYGRGGDNPPTGDNIIEYIVMLVISLLGFISLKKIYNSL